MPTLTKLEPSDHQVAIAGKVVDAVTRRPLPGVRVEIIDAPGAFVRWIELRKVSHGDAWSSLLERPDRRLSSPKGLFYFLNLPDGEYTLSLVLPEAGGRLGKAEQGFVVARDPDGRIDATPITVDLTPTGGQGRIVGAAGAPLAMARILIVGSGEETYSEPDGGYSLTRVEPGARALSISLPGFKTTTTTVTLVEGVMAPLGDTALSPN
jgi:hypothetical protein